MRLNEIASPDNASSAFANESIQKVRQHLDSHHGIHEILSPFPKPFPLELLEPVRIVKRSADKTRPNNEKVLDILLQQMLTPCQEIDELKVKYGQPPVSPAAIAGGDALRVAE